MLEWHLERLASGCRELDMVCQPDLEALKRRIGRLLELNRLHDAYFRLTVTAGVNVLGLPAGSYEKPVEVLYVKSLPPMDSVVYREGKALQLLKLRRSTPEGTVRLKSLHYMNNILAKKEMKRYPWAAGAEGLFLDAGGHLCEGIVSNVFFLRQGSMYTPAVETGLLPGVTRRYVISAAESEGLNVSEGLYDWDDLLEADEVFVTNSIQELVPITTLFDETGKAQRIGSGSVGPTTMRLLQAYRAAAARRNDRA
ncbi:4-amino-4-deoxychorismate lyase [Paenibacillus sp. PvP052]|nr:4-amino-4-deoxychorismate lyase [Paenibacillus sp. PvP091]MBP2442136.1 4-amino-4-deoxychorismate lyase [Paenibacillus sp. PvP052]